MTTPAIKTLGLRTAICGLSLLAMVIAALAFATLYGDTTTPSVQAAGITLGVDVTTDGNTASALGTIDNCRRVEVGNDFDVDLFVSDVPGLQGFDIYVGFDESLLQMTNETPYMVIGPNASVIDPVYHQYFLSVGGTTPKSGSGVLARLTFQAMAAGASNVAIVHSPAWPILSGQSGPIGDTSGDGYFDGPTVAASIAIGQDCSGTPVVTDSPGPTVTALPTPSPTPSPTSSATPAPTPTPTQTPVVTLAPTPTPAPTSSQIILGDADCSGTIGLPDVTTALKYASHLGPGSACQGRTDTDCDGFVTASDVLRILRFLAGDALPQPTDCAQIGSTLSG